MKPAVTDQITAAGRAIESESFSIVDKEAGEHGYDKRQWPVVRRMIHSTADFDFASVTRFHPDAVAAGMAAFKAGALVVADVGMIAAGLSKIRLAHFGSELVVHISDDDVIAAAKEEGTTRAVMAMRKAAKEGRLNGAIVGVGNAPTALFETIRLVKEEGARPALVVGMPVGFVSAVESKEELMTLTEIPWIATSGRKGGAALVVATLHALMALAEKEE